MYFCDGLNVNNNTRKGVNKSIVYTSNIATNDWVFNNGKIEIVDGKNLMFAVKQFGFYKAVNFDMLQCGDDFMLIKLLSGALYVKGGQNNEVTLCVSADGNVGMVEPKEDTAIKWYDVANIRVVLNDYLRNQYDLPKGFEPTTSMYNNLMFTLTCENKPTRTSTAGKVMCSVVTTNEIKPFEGYDFDKVINNAKAPKKQYGLTMDMVDKQKAYYMEHKEEVDKDAEERRQKAAELSGKPIKAAKKPSTKGLTRKKTKVVVDDYDSYLDAADAEYDMTDEDSEYDGIDADSDDAADDSLSADELQEILNGVKFKEASMRDSEQM